LVILRLRPWRDPVRPAPAFLEATGAALLVGRIASFRGLGEDLLERFDRWQEASPTSMLVPAHDLSRFEEYVGFDGSFRVAAGSGIACVLADDGPSHAIGLEDVEAAAVRARENADALYDAIARDLSAREAAALLLQPTRPLLVPFGPIASARLAYGIRVRPSERASSPEKFPARIQGSDMMERRHAFEVHGRLVASASDWDIAEPILDRASHDARALPGAAYHVVAHYG
jgi:hypothetical protein